MEGVLCSNKTCSLATFYCCVCLLLLGVIDSKSDPSDNLFSPIRQNAYGKNPKRHPNR